MRIQSTNYPENLGGDGLGQIKLSRLPRIVIVAGPNGSGKTRLFRRLIALDGCSQNPSDKQGNYMESHFAKRLASDDGDKAFANTICNSHSFSSGEKYTLPSLHTISDTRDAKFKIAAFLTSPETPLDPSEQTPSGLLKSSDNAKTLGLASVVKNTFSYITKVQARWWEATHQNSQLGTEET